MADSDAGDCKDKGTAESHDASGGPEEKAEDAVSALPDMANLVDKDAQSTSDWLSNMLEDKMGNLFQSAPKVEQLLSEVNYDGIIKYIQDGKCTNIITMAGAGISTSAGIPDFRTPGTGLYDNLAKYDLPNPQAIFEIHFFRKNPAPFYALAKELYPGVFKPTPCHYFLRLLHEKKLLLRHYTQNIDTLERVAGIPEEMIVEAHGTFATAHCIDCRKQFSQEWVKDKVFADEIPKCTDKKCGGLVKPDIVFFGENLPFRFLSCSMKDFPKCDLLIILGTSLAVQPFASLIDRVPDTTPRLYINLEKSESDASNLLSKLMGGGGGFDFESDSKYRDVFWQGTCDDGCVSLSERLGWKAELDKLTLEEHAKIDKEIEMKEAKERSKGLSRRQHEGPVRSNESPLACCHQ